jgi:hypothetical protein
MKISNDFIGLADSKVTFILVLFLVNLKNLLARSNYSETNMTVKIG